MSHLDVTDPAVWVPIGVMIITGFAGMQTAIFRKLNKHDVALALLLQAMEWPIKSRSPSSKQSLQDTLNDVTED